jgi:digeranylgeranylglycerophospholipid reductase
MDIKALLDRWVAKDPRMKRAQFLDMVTGGVSTSPPIPESVGNGIALVGDAARMIDPITGGGIGNGCRAGRILGEVLARCAETNDFSKEALQPYEKGWRKILEEQLWRNWLAKNKLCTLSDEVFDKLISTLATASLTKLSIHTILRVIKDKHPELVKEFEDLI